MWSLLGGSNVLTQGSLYRSLFKGYASRISHQNATATGFDSLLHHSTIPNRAVDSKHSFILVWRPVLVSPRHVSQITINRILHRVPSRLKRQGNHVPQRG